MTYVPKPMLAKATAESDLTDKDWTGFIAGVKLDGARAMVHRSTEGVEIYTRTGKRYTEHVPHLVDVFMDLPIGTVLDGELACVTDDVDVAGKPVPLVDFNKTMRVLGSLPERAISLQQDWKLSFVAFDTLQYGPTDKRQAVQRHRMYATRKILRQVPSPYVLQETLYGDPTKYGEIYTELMAHGTR